MISGRRSDTTYEQTEYLNPGLISSVTAAPPRTCRRSSTSTFRPARARYAALTRPLWPPPITMTSYWDICGIADGRVVLNRDAIAGRVRVGAARRTARARAKSEAGGAGAEQV